MACLHEDSAGGMKLPMYTQGPEVQTAPWTDEELEGLGALVYPCLDVQVMLGHLLTHPMLWRLCHFRSMQPMAAPAIWPPSSQVCGALTVPHPAAGGTSVCSNCNL